MVGGPPNIEQPIVVQKKKLKKISDYVIILPIEVLSHVYGVLINKKHDIVFCEVGIGVPLSVLNFSYRLYVKKHVPDIALLDIPYFEKFNLTAGGNMHVVQLEESTPSVIPTRGNQSFSAKFFGRNKSSCIKPMGE